jgi:hypothetical protein
MKTTRKDKIKAWAIVDRTDIVEAFYTGYWIFSTRKEALKELSDWFFNSKRGCYKIISVIITPVKSRGKKK